jgi:acyl-ACP thioesterase
MTTQAENRAAEARKWGPKETYRLQVDPFSTDNAGRWAWPNVGIALLNAAEYHASHRGFGMSGVGEDDCSWVLSRLTIEMHEMPETFAEVEVETWIESIYRQFTNRNFAIRSAADGHVYGYARSVWALISRTTRQAQDLTQLTILSEQFGILPDEPCPVGPVARIRPLAEQQPADTIEARFTDLDLNGHVNSMKYVGHILNLLPLSAFQNGHNLQRLDIAYMSESYYGDRLSFFHHQQADGVHDIEVRRALGPSSAAPGHFDESQTTQGPIVRCRLKFV